MREVVGQPPSSEQPYIWNDDQQPLDKHIAQITDNIVSGGTIVTAMKQLVTRY